MGDRRSEMGDRSSEMGGRCVGGAGSREHGGNAQRSTLNVQLLTINHQLSTINQLMAVCRVIFKTGILCAIKTGNSVCDQNRTLVQKTGQWRRTMGWALGSGA